MNDIILRATAADSFVRAFVADTREMVQTAYEKHSTMPVVTAALGRTLTAAAMMSCMQKNAEDRLTIKIKGNGPAGGIIVTADGACHVKGFAENPYVDIPLKPNGKLDVSGAVGQGTLSVIKDMGLKEPYIGEINIQTGEIAEDITYYFSVSEQIPSSVGLGVLVDTDMSVKCAGGFIIQLMPFAPDEVIDRLENNLSDIKSVTSMYASGMTAEDILNKILEGMNPEIVDRLAPEYKCDCSKDKVERALKLLDQSEIDSMIADGEPVNIHCDFCNKDYTFEIEDLKKM